MGDDCCKWKFCTKSGLKQVKVECGDDLRRLKDLDQKYWTASFQEKRTCPVWSPLNGL